jgi:PPOX class probable F420-dependent enzyme
MDTIPQSLRELLATGPLATVVTIDPDGKPHVTIAWAGFDGDEIVMATFFNLGQRKLENVRRDPRVVLSFQANEFSGQGLWPYAVIEGRVDRITEGGALDVMDRLSEHYLGPGQRYPMREVPDGVVLHVTVERVYGQGPWVTAPGSGRG